jgi:hypothetical protein
MLKLLPSFAKNPYAKQSAEGFQNKTQQNLKQINLNKKANVYGSGVNGSEILDSEPSYNFEQGSSVFKNNGSYIVLGKDAPNGPGTGNSKLGARCATIDIMCAPASAVVDAAKNSNLFVNSNFSADAARIYVSEFTDLDEITGIPKTKLSFESRSGIAAIADNVAVKGRLGVKIATSPNGEYNSKSGKISSGTGIELIANSNEKDLQPLVKGENLEKALESIYERLQALHEAVMDTTLQNIKLTAALAAHTHVSPVGPTTPSLDLAPSALNNITKNSQSGLVNMFKSRMNLLFDEVDYTFSLGDKYINSTFNRTN